MTTPFTAPDWTPLAWIESDTHDAILHAHPGGRQRDRQADRAADDSRRYYNGENEDGNPGGWTSGRWMAD